MVWNGLENLILGEILINDMKISGFTMVRNATKLFYPVKESIESILPIVDEFVVALGDCDADDQTEQEINSIGSDKIKIIRTVWDLNTYTHGTEYAHQTDIAKSHCTGDWLFYLQSDEVIHEQYLPIIKKACEDNLNDQRVEGLLFKYRHFWGDFDHYIVSHAWYPREIRIIRNLPDIHSWRDAQSFRKIPNFDGRSYNAKEGTSKLSVIQIDAYVHHYGFVRPPHLMQKKRKNHTLNYIGAERMNERYKDEPEVFYYGDLSKFTRYTDSQPKAIAEWIKKFNWADQLVPQDPSVKVITQKHDKLKYRMLTLIEQNFLGGNLIGGFKNYELLK